MNLKSKLYSLILTDIKNIQNKYINNKNFYFILDFSYYKSKYKNLEKKKNFYIIKFFKEEIIRSKKQRKDYDIKTIYNFYLSLRSLQNI